MIEIIHFAFAILYIYGFHHLFDYETTIEGKYDAKSSMIFGWAAFKLDKIIGLPYTNPLYACMPCMASVHGLAFYVLSPLEFTIFGLIAWIIALSGAMKLMSKL